MPEHLLDRHQVHAALVLWVAHARRRACGLNQSDWSRPSSVIRYRRRLRTVPGCMGPPDSSGKSTGHAGNQSRSSRWYQASTVSSPSSIGTHLGRGHLDCHKADRLQMPRRHRQTFLRPRPSRQHLGKPGSAVRRAAAYSTRNNQMTEEPRAAEHVRAPVGFDATMPKTSATATVDRHGVIGDHSPVLQPCRPGPDPDGRARAAGRANSRSAHSRSVCRPWSEHAGRKPRHLGLACRAADH